MLETLPYDPVIAQKAREMLLEFNSKFKETEVEPALLCQMQNYLNNLITLHAQRSQALEESVSGLA